MTYSCRIPSHVVQEGSDSSARDVPNAKALLVHEIIHDPFLFSGMNTQPNWNPQVILKACESISAQFLHPISCQYTSPPHLHLESALSSVSISGFRNFLPPSCWFIFMPRHEMGLVILLGVAHYLFDPCCLKSCHAQASVADEITMKMVVRMFPDISLKNVIVDKLMSSVMLSPSSLFCSISRPCTGRSSGNNLLSVLVVVSVLLRLPVVAVSSTTSNNEGGGDDVVVWWCGTCLFDFDNDTHVPMILECGHCMCKSCVDSSVAFGTLAHQQKSLEERKSSSNYGTNQETTTATGAQNHHSVLVCAKCSAETKVLNSNCLKTNESLCSEMQSNCGERCTLCEKTSICFDCTTCGHIFCEECWVKWHNKPKLKTHKKIPVLTHAAQKGLPNSANCPVHLEEMKLYCVNDKSLICASCAFSEKHQGHKITPVVEYVASMPKELGKKTDELISVKEKIQGLLSSLVTVGEEVDLIHSKFESEVTVKTQEMVSLLEARRDELIKASQHIKLEKMKNLGEQKQSLEVVMEKVEAVLSTSQSLPQQSPFEITFQLQQTESALERLSGFSFVPIENSHIGASTETSKTEASCKSFGFIVNGDLPSKPDKPKLMKATRTSLCVACSPPANCGSSPILSFKLFHSTSSPLDERQVEWHITELHQVTQAVEVGTTLDSLERGSSHWFRVTAINRVGESEPSDIVQFQTLSAKEFRFESDFDTNGIIYWLGTQKRSPQELAPSFCNPEKCGLASTQFSETYHGPKASSNVLERFWSGGQNHTSGKPGSWWMVDLKGLQVSPTHYSLRADSHTDQTVRNWNLEGWTDQQQQWVVLSTHKNDTTIKCGKSYAVGSWPIPTQDAAFSKFRITETGPNARNEYELQLSGFELYGFVINP
ncbi:E3 ubiquitin-protein ligase HECTD1 [Pelomyxa schiedti]|nr:E3 ubiquitin-protein ligase HECTD1 [Pelomyxa schiedti]